MFAEVIVDVVNNQVDRIFDYEIPNGLAILKGTRVLVPFANRTVEGYVINIKENSNFDLSRVKQIIKTLDDMPMLSSEILDLCFFMKKHFHIRMVDAIRLMIPSQVRSGHVKEIIQKKVILQSEEEILNKFLTTLRKNATQQMLAIKYLMERGSELLSVLNQKFGNASVRKLIQEKVFIVVEQQILRNPMQNVVGAAHKNIVLNSAQENAIQTILNGKKTQKFLLHGVTGSGKTEVYMNVINKVITNGQTALMLVPEISLTPQVVSQFKTRFGEKIAVLHSGLSNGEKYDEWYRIFNGDANVVVGARSAVFAPLKNIGVIIIDEEHDSSYVSDSNPRYNTYEVAEFRCESNGCPLVLGSATPSIESYYKASNGLNGYEIIELPVRVNDMEMPSIEIVDMTHEFRSGNTSVFSNNLLTSLEHVIKNKQQAILFINRRGFSSFLMCKECGYIPTCTSCDISLVYHKEENELKCHFCGKRFKVINVCPNCGSKNIKLGGIGTERVVSELKRMFPTVGIYRMDNDTTTTKNSHAQILNAFSASKPGILVGTQMIAKGHDFPEVTLVGILDADLSLYFSDFRACEKTFQLITQVAGRAGRSKLTGNVILQTYFPKHYVYKLAANYDYKHFYEKEINLRQTTLFPPFSKIVRILITSELDDVAKNFTHQLFIKLKELKITYGKEFYFLEAMKSPVTKIKNKFRYQIVMRFNEQNEKLLNEIYFLTEQNQNNKITCFIETNPINLS